MEEQTINGLPNGWKWIKLSEVGDIISGGTPSTNVAEYWNGEISWITPADLSGYTNKTISKGRKSITESGLKNSSARLMPEGSVVFSSRAPIGYVAIAAKKLATNQGFKSIVPNEKIDSEYLYYFLRHSKRKAEEAASGTTFKEISLKRFAELEVPVPNVLKQRQIVSKIEELFSELDKGAEELKTAQQQLKVYRQAVLKWAFEGKLTNDDVEDGELLEGWEIKMISEVSKVNPKLTKESIDNELEVQFLPMKLVEEIINRIHLTEIKKFKEVQKGSYTPFINNDIIFAKVTPCMENGKIAVVENLKNGIGYGSSEFHVLRCSDKLLNKYLFYFIVQDKFRNEAANAMTGAVGLRRVPKQFIENYPIPLPPLEEQHQIVQEIESRLSVCDKIEETITASLKQAEALRQSILKQAFEGRLV